MTEENYTLKKQMASGALVPCGPESKPIADFMLQQGATSLRVGSDRYQLRIKTVETESVLWIRRRPKGSSVKWDPTETTVFVTRDQGLVSLLSKAFEALGDENYVVGDFEYQALVSWRETTIN